MKTSHYFLIGMAVMLFCNISQGYSMTPSINNHNYQAENDTTIYDGDNPPDFTAALPNAINYFLENNKYKDWKEIDRKMVVIQGIVEKDGTITNVAIRRSSQIEELDKEAVRLINAAKYIPAKKLNRGKAIDVRSKFTILVHFPPQKQ